MQAEEDGRAALESKGVGDYKAVSAPLSMTPYRRNIAVGMTMLGAMVALAWMILKFGDRPARLLAPPTMPVRFEADVANGVAEGSLITYRGVPVGRVERITLNPDKLHVRIHAQIYTHETLPGNLQGVINSQLFGGAASLSLQLLGPQPEGTLKADAVLSAHFAGVAVLPPEFVQLASEMRLAVADFRRSNIVAHVDEQVRKTGKILDSVDQLVSDPKLREDVRQAVASIRTATETATRVAAKLEATTGQVSETLGDVKTTIGKTNTSIETVGRQITDRLEQVGRTLANLESITAKIDKGEGTAGALVNDAKLYQSLVDTAKVLNSTVADLKRLAEQWEQEGLHLKF